MRTLHAYNYQLHMIVLKLFIGVTHEDEKVLFVPYLQLKL